MRQGSISATSRDQVSSRQVKKSFLTLKSIRSNPNENVGNPVEKSGSGRKAAETLAAEAFSWATEDVERLNAFMAMTGASPADLVREINSAAFLGRVLDWLLTEDALIRDFCDSRGLPYTAPMQARQQLPGGEVWNWT
jgi:Protein of unknown function (DUF3572)